MNTIEIGDEPGVISDTYLGYGIVRLAGTYQAIPIGWHGETLLAETLPTLRRKIWRFWHL